MTYAFIGGTLIDGTGNDIKPNTTVVVNESKIVEITDKTNFGSDVELFDVSGKILMPGIIDTHLHYMPWMQWLISKQEHTLSYHIARGIAGMAGTLERGVTTARDMGGLEIGICQAQEESLIVGPRTKTVCVIIQATNGITDYLPGVGGAISPQGIVTSQPGIPYPWANGVDECRAKVREALRAGAHFIKMANSASPFHQPHLKPDRPLFTQKEVEAIVDETHRAGTEVCCHVCGFDTSLPVKEALLAGVDVIDHGVYLDDECIGLMAKQNTWLSPTFAVFKWHAEKNPNPYARKMAEKSLEKTKVSFQKALEAGVRICMGTDAAYEVGWHGEEMELMVEYGMTPMQAILASTKLAAEALRMQDLVGTLEVGKEADMLVLDGDPLENIGIVSDPKHLSLVMQAGKPCSGPMKTQFPYQAPSKTMNQFY